MMLPLYSRTLRGSSRRLAVTVVALGIIGAAGCKGDPGPAGTSCTVVDNGDGTKTITCEDDTTVTVSDGEAGGTCTVTDNLDGTKTITCDDGTEVTVNDGADGDGCVIVDNGDGTKTITCADGTIVTVSDGDDGSSVATVEFHLTDADNGADIIGADLLVTPGEFTATTDSSGRATFSDLPIGVYEFTATAPRLEVDDDVVTEGASQTATTAALSIAAGTTVSIEFTLTRFDTQSLNLVKVHDADDASFNVANCEACHNDRSGELSDDSTLLPFHALTSHGSVACTTCHESIDLYTKSGASLRKQVDVTLCAACHLDYPASF